MSNIEKATSELHRCFALFNQHLFNNELEEPAITIQSKGKRNSMGWCSLDKRWKGEKQERYEINISAEYLDIDYLDTMDTLLHEMIHLYNIQNNIQDVSRNGTYHNKRFKQACLDHGMIFEEDKPDKKHGWSFAKLAPNTITLITDTFNVSQEAFSLARKTAQATAKGNPKSYKLQCPQCSMKLRATKQGLNVACLDCKVQLIEY
jgi:hypothetical protein